MNWIGVGVGAVVGVLVGSSITYALTKKHYEQLLTVEIQSVKDVYKLQSEKQIEDVSETETDVSGDEAVAQVREILSVNNYTEAFSTTQEINRETQGLPVTSEWVLMDDDMEETVKETEELVKTKSDFDIVSFDDFLVYDESIERVFLSYHPKTGMLLTEDDEVIENKVSVIGQEGLNCIIKNDIEGDSLYVINNSRNTLYEVFVMDH